MEPCTATGASTDCWHSQAQVQVLAAEVSMTQSGAECGKCSLAAMPREEQAGLGLPAAGLQCRVRRAGCMVGAARVLLTRHRQSSHYPRGPRGQAQLALLRSVEQACGKLP